MRFAVGRCDRCVGLVTDDIALGGFLDVISRVEDASLIMTSWKIEGKFKLRLIFLLEMVKSYQVGVGVT